LGLVQFEGVLSDDHKCFCWDVNKKTLLKYCPKEEVDYRKSCFNKNLYKLYPSDIFGCSNKKVKVSIQFTIFD